MDSPGLEEDETRQKLTVRFLNECDAAIMVLSCLQLLTLQELKFVREELIGRGYDHIFYAVNYADHLTEDDELDIWERVREKIGNPDRTFIISARDALNGRLHGDEISLANSRFPSLEKALETFLVRDRGYVKLQSAQGMLDTYIDELGELTEIRLNLLERSKLEDLQKLEKQFEKSRVSISEKKEYIVMRIGQAGAHIGERLYNSFSRRCRSIAGNLRPWPENLSWKAVSLLKLSTGRQLLPILRTGSSVKSVIGRKAKLGRSSGRRGSRFNV